MIIKGMISRSLQLPPHPSQSFFLWGPRQTGKSTLLKHLYPHAHWVDLLKTEQLVGYLQQPSLLREEVLRLPERSLVIIDEIQKVPLLLDEVHWLIENRGCVFGLSGSSARKVKRGHANLLGGRAHRYELHGLVSEELGHSFNLSHLLNSGYFPRHYLSSHLLLDLEAYVNDYLKEEIINEGILQNLPTFSAFLHISAISDTEIINFSNIARECHVSVPTARGYFQILVDTLLGSFLPSYTKRPKRRIVQAPKFYSTDVGLVNFLAKRGELQPGGELFGKAFENWVFHELNSYNQYRKKFLQFSYWRLTTGVEVDFIVNDMECAIEAKASSNIGHHHLKSLRELKHEHRVPTRVLVSLVSISRRTEDGIDILSPSDFTTALWSGKLW